MTLTRDHLRRIVAVAHARNLEFVELVGLAELDPAEAFKGAILKGTALRGQDLAGFDFTDADFTGCDLSGADLSRTVGVTRAMLAGAQIDGKTRLPRNSFWATGRPPAWADDWGTDEHGAWVTFSVSARGDTKVTQKLRWIPAGRFKMGSPENEPDRLSIEGPLHDVTFQQGFWMFDTACTEALWVAVMDKPAPSSRGEMFPVSDVSWKDAKQFLKRLNAAKPSLDLCLPSEAAWEYACRAGTNMPYHFGTAINRDLVCYESDAPVVAGSLPPNAWGLHEMHGNLWEWCEDTWHSNYDGAPADGSAWVEPGAASRVFRGGPWLGNAQYVRAAFRNGSVPSDRGGHLGFRCARVQGSGAEQAAEPADPASRVSAERARPQGPLGDDAKLRIRRLTKPAWASAIDRDVFGLFTEIRVPETDVTQKLRWIPPGRFMMGSPEDEPGRWSAEGPRHEVVLTQGYWLFDTPCTQAFWEAVMGKNPSRFKTPTRPVEQVSFEDVSKFLEELNARVDGLNLCLPSEAQWEYACRAGTDTATYAGGMPILGENNAPVLDAIAWYGGNSGVGFELDNGADSSGWPKKQYGHKRAGTHPVGQKAANPFGLYDMLGNVWEWCEDTWHNNYDGAPADGSAWVDKGVADRVVRGGSWYNTAQHVRAARRYCYDPSDRGDDLGFRCARVQDSETANEMEHRAGRSKPRTRSGPAATTSPPRPQR